MPRRNPDESLRRLKLAADAGGPEELKRYLRAKLRTLSYPIIAHVEPELALEGDSFPVFLDDPVVLTVVDVEAYLLEHFTMLVEEQIDRGLTAGEYEVIGVMTDLLLQDFTIADYEED